MRSEPSLAAMKPLCVFLSLWIAGVALAAAQSPLIERAQPDEARRARSAAWLDGFSGQRPALLLAISELQREQDLWTSGQRGVHCHNAQRALGEVDRNSLLAAPDYRLVSAVGRAMEALEGAVWACQRRRYFELDYRLGLARQSLLAARELARAQAGR